MTAIQWTDETWNPTLGCSKCSPGCDHCYAIGVAAREMQPAHVGLTIRWPGEPVDWTGEVRLMPDRLETPFRWRKPRRVFVDSMSDLFHADVPADYIADVFATMIASGHTFQVLTKRPQRMAHLVGSDGFEATVRRKVHKHETHMFAGWPYPTVWLGASIETDSYAFRADHVRATPAAVRFLSLEPLLGPLPSLDFTGIDWVIIGGESGRGARRMELAWCADLIDRARHAGAAVFVKQLGTVLARQLRVSGKGGDPDEWPEWLRVRDWPVTS